MSQHARQTNTSYLRSCIVHMCCTHLKLVGVLFPAVVVRYMENGTADNDEFVAITSEAFTEESARVVFAGTLKLLRCALRQASLKPEVIGFTRLCDMFCVC